MINAKITGTGSYVPEYILTNAELSGMMDTSDEWIVSHTGIRERHICQSETVWEMGLHAARSALENAGKAPEDVDLIIGCSATPDYEFPPMSCIVQGKLGAKNAFCFDLSAACTAFVFALNTAKQYIQTRQARTVLIVCSEMLSRVMDYTDRTTCILFGDAAAAAVVEASETGGVLSAYCRSDGTGANLLGCRGLVNNSPWAKPGQELIPELQGHYTYMAGHEIFKFAVRAMSEAMDRALEAAGAQASDIKYMVPHQANLRIIQSMARRYGLSMDKVKVNMDRYGNTSSASIPLALDELNRDGAIQPGDKLMLIGFGGGLTYGAAMIEW